MLGMSDSEAIRARRRLTLLMITLATLPCYCLGWIAVQLAPGPNAPTVTVTVSETLTPTLLSWTDTPSQTPEILTVTASATLTETPTLTSTVTNTPFLPPPTFTASLTFTPSFTPSPSLTPSPTYTFTPTETNTPFLPPTLTFTPSDTPTPTITSFAP